MGGWPRGGWQGHASRAFNRRLIDAPDSDILDVLAYVRIRLAPLKCAGRVNAVQASRLSGYEREMRCFLDYVLEACRRQGIDELAPSRLAGFLRIRYGGTDDDKRILGTIPDIRNAFVAVQAYLFQGPWLGRRHGCAVRTATLPITPDRLRLPRVPAPRAGPR